MAVPGSPGTVRVEIHVLLCRPRNRGDVVNARNAERFCFGSGDWGHYSTFGPFHGRFTCLRAFQRPHSSVRFRSGTRPGARVILESG